MLKMYRINGDQVSRIILSAQPYLREDTKIAFGGHYVHGDIKDLYMIPDNIYVLFSKYQTMPESVLDKYPSAFSGRLPAGAYNKEILYIPTLTLTFSPFGLYL